MTIVTIIIWLLLCWAVANWAHNKGRNAGAAFLLALVLSPLIGFLVVATLRNKRAEAHQAALLAATKQQAAPAAIAGDTRACPRCAETIKAAAVVCRFCNSQIEPAAV